MPDPQLASALTAIEAVSPLNGTAFNPATLIRAVNTLVSMEEGRATDAVRVYARAADERRAIAGEELAEAERVILTMRLLFVTGEAGPSIPLPALGMPDIALVRDLALCPAWPLLVEDDIPFLPIGSFHLGGIGTGAEMYLEQCLASGTLRAKPLAPRSSPLEAVEALVDSTGWQRVLPVEQQARARGMVRLQALNAMDNLSAVEPRERADLIGTDNAATDRAWDKLADDEALRSSRWDFKIARFA